MIGQLAGKKEHSRCPSEIELHHYLFQQTEGRLAPSLQIGAFYATI